MDHRIETVRSRMAPGSEALAAFDLLLAHATAAGFRLVPSTTGLVNSVEFQYPDRAANPFSAIAASGHVLFYIKRAILGDRADVFQAATDRYGLVRPNRLGEYRRRLRTTGDVEDILSFLREQAVWPRDRHAARFTAETFEVVTARHLLAAARRLAAGMDPHPFAPSTDYDVVFEGRRLPPKALFGIAAGAALGFELKPENFRGGEGTQCFRILRRCGYEIIAKSESLRAPLDDLSSDDRTWSEGRPRLVTHLRRERGAGLAAAKREEFRAEHGRLLCERCGMDPVATYGADAGEACIEIHHDRMRIADMGDGHETSLDELVCLCANCHRIVHREMKVAASNSDRSSNGIDRD